MAGNPKSVAHVSSLNSPNLAGQRHNVALQACDLLQLLLARINLVEIPTDPQKHPP